MDAIFRTGHWNQALASSFAESLGGLVPSQSASDPAEVKAAKILRKEALRQRMQRKKWLAGNMEPGQCQGCRWQTDWDRNEDYRPRTQCWVCQRIYCKRWCSNPETARGSVISATLQERPHVALRFAG